LEWIRSIFPTSYDALKMETFYDAENTGIVEPPQKTLHNYERGKNFT